MPSAIRVVTRVQDQDDVQGPPVDGQFLRWDAGLGKYVHAAGTPAVARLEFAFGWGDASPKTLATAPAGKLVERVTLFVTAAFDGAGAALAVGDAGDPGRLLATGENDPASPGVYEVRPAHAYGSATPLLLAITPGAGATSGSGLIVLEIQG